MSDRMIHIGHGYQNNPWENPEELLQDMESGIPLIRKALESELKVNLQDEVKEIRFDCMYKVPAKKDAQWVVENAESTQGFDQHLSGHRSEGRIKLYPTMFMNDARMTLSPTGLIEITVSPMGSDAYNVRFEYGLSDMEAFVKYARLNFAKSAAIVAGLEESCPRED